MHKYIYYVLNVGTKHFDVELHFDIVNVLRIWQKMTSKTNSNQTFLMEFKLVEIEIKIKHLITRII